MSFAERKRHRQGEHPLSQSDAGGMPEHRRIAAVPNGPRIVEDLEYPVSIFDGIMRESVSAQRIQVELVPAPEGAGVAEHKSFEEGGLAGDRPGRQIVYDYTFAPRQHVPELHPVTRIGEVAAENFGGRAQAVPCVQVMLVLRILQTPMIAQS